MLKAKQESFRMLNEDLTKKQKLIDDQTQVIKNLKEKIEQIEEQYQESRSLLEKRLGEKETDLQVKIAQFESNLHEGKHYFEEILNEKENLLREKCNEIQKLKDKLFKYEPNENENSESLSNNNHNNEINDTSITLSSSLLNQSTIKFDSDNMKSMKSLYEHQIELLKVKIEMLEKTCTNYQQGIKEMNRNFGFQQQHDEIQSMQTFKDLMQQLQKQNVELETEKIDLQVKCSKLKEDLEQARIEKENINKKFLLIEQQNQKLVAEKNDLETNLKQQLELKNQEYNHLAGEFHNLSYENEQLRQEFEKLVEMRNEYEQLKMNNQQLVQHYEQLYQQATDIVNGNQMLNDQVNSLKAKCDALEGELNDSKLAIDTLQQSNSILNTEKVDLEMKLSDSEEKCKLLDEYEKELAELRIVQAESVKTSEQLRETLSEIEEKSELIDQLNQAKEFLAENNSKLLTNNIKLQLFIESMGFDQQFDVESNTKVKEYELMSEKVRSNELELNEIRIKSKQLEIDLMNTKQDLESKIRLKDGEILDLTRKLEKLELVVEKVNIYTQYDLDTNEFKVHVHTQYELEDDYDENLTQMKVDKFTQYDLITPVEVKSAPVDADENLQQNQGKYLNITYYIKDFQYSNLNIFLVRD